MNAMEDKKEIIQTLLPIAVLQPMSPDALAAIPQGMLANGFVCIIKFPYRIGRESRVQKINGQIHRIERPKMGDREPNNELYLIDRGALLNISREHLLIERSGDTYVLIDRGSACGTEVNDEPLGGNDSGGTSVLTDGDIITVGTHDSPYRFRFIDLSGFEIDMK